MQNKFKNVTSIYMYMYKFGMPPIFFHTKCSKQKSYYSYQPLYAWSFHCTVCIHVTSTTVFTEINQCTPSITGIIFKSRKTATVILQNKIKKTHFY